MDISGESPSRPDDLITYRVEAFFRILRDVREEVGKSKIRGPAEGKFKTLISDITTSLEAELKDIISEISEISDQNIRIHRSGTIHRIFEDFHYVVSSIIRQSQQIPVELYYFIDDMLFQLKEVPEIHYVLICGPDLSTTNFSDGLVSLFRTFPETRNKIYSIQRYLWEVSIPPFLLTNPMDWPMIIHEMGHIMEKQFFKVVDEYYTPEEADIKYNYAIEFQADYIATCLMGPVFAVRVLINYFTKEIRISHTHPAWKERLDAIEEHLKKNNLSFEEYKTMSKNLPPESPRIRRDNIEHLSDIFKKTYNHIKDAIYKTSSADEAKALKKLKRFAPYTDNIRVLLNVAEKGKKHILSLASNSEKREQLEREFNYLLSDAIRMSYLKNFFAPVFRIS